MGKARRGLRQAQSQPRKALKGAELAKKVAEAITGIDQKLIGFVQAFQKNLNQLYMNQKAISDMAYTNNVHASVLRQVMFEKGLLTEQEYSERIEKELAVREAIQKKQMEEAQQQVEELRKRQAEEASAKVADAPAAPSEEPVEPKIFGGNLAEEGDGQAAEREQGHHEDHVPSVQE